MATATVNPYLAERAGENVGVLSVAQRRRAVRQTRHLTGCVFIVSDVQRRGQENDAVIQKGDAEKIIHRAPTSWRASSTATVEYPSGRTCRRIHRSIALSTNHPNTSCVPRTRPSAPCASARAIPEVTISVYRRHAERRLGFLDASRVHQVQRALRRDEDARDEKNNGTVDTSNNMRHECLGKIIHANADSIIDPSVQNNSMSVRCTPRFSLGKNSINNPYATGTPPRPIPTINLKTSPTRTSHPTRFRRPPPASSPRSPTSPVSVLASRSSPPTTAPQASSPRTPRSSSPPPLSTTPRIHTASTVL